MDWVNSLFANIGVSDTTEVHSSNAAKYKIIQLYFKELFIQKAKQLKIESNCFQEELKKEKTL